MFSKDYFWLAGCLDTRHLCQIRGCIVIIDQSLLCGHLYSLSFVNEYDVSYAKNIWPEGMKFGSVKYVKETLSRVGYVCEMNFDPFARHKIFSGCSLITCSKWFLIDFCISTKGKSNFILNSWSENSPKIRYAAQVDQSLFHIHVQHVIKFPSHTSLDQCSLPSVWILVVKCNANI